MKWYKRDPDAWLGGVVGMSPAERGIYDTVIDTLYARNLCVPKPDDDRFWSRACCCDPRTWRTIRDRLIAKGKLSIQGGELMARRVRDEFERASKRIQVMSKLRQKQLKNQSTDYGGPARTTTTTTTTRKKKDAAHAANDFFDQDPERDLFRRGKEVAGQQAGGLIKQVLQAKNGDVALARAAIETASTKQNPREYLAAVAHKGRDGPQPDGTYREGNYVWRSGIPGVA